MSDTNNEEGRWLEGLDERTEQERMVEFHAEELPDFWTWLRDQKLPMEGDTISLRRVESLVHQAWVAGAALSFRPPVPAESSEGVWTCGHCGRSSEAHGMPEHPAYQCVYAPVWKPLDPVTPQVTSDPSGSATRDSLRVKLWEYLGTETYICERDASAWGYGTMSLDDFRLAREDDEFLDSVLDLLDSPMKGETDDNAKALP